MELRHVTTFQMVASLRSFTRAAHTLGYSQASITAHIQTLEAELGVPLFDRLGRQTVLTSAGERFLSYAGRLLQLADEARSAAAPGDDPQGTITISAPESVCTYRLPSILQAARIQLPRVRPLFRPIAAPDLLRQLRQGDLDVAFVMAAPITDPALAVAGAIAEPVVVVSRPDHPLATQESIRPLDLLDQSLLLTEPGCTYRVRFEQVLTAHGVAPLETLEFTSVEAIKQCVIAGMGLAVLPHMTVAREQEQGLLRVLPWNGPTLDVITQIVWHASRWRSPALGAFLDLAVQMLGQR